MKSTTRFNKGKLEVTCTEFNRSLSRSFPAPKFRSRKQRDRFREEKIEMVKLQF